MVQSPRTSTSTGAVGTTVETGSHSSATLVGSSDSPSTSSRSDASSSESDSDSDSSADEEDSESEVSEDEDEEEETIKLEQLLIKARESAKQRQLEEKERKKSAGMKGGDGDGLAGNEEMVLFGMDQDDEEEGDSDEEEGNDGTPKASTSKSHLPAASLVRPLSSSFSLVPSTSNIPLETPAVDLKGKSRAGPIALSQDLAGVLKSTQNGQGEKWGLAPVPRLSKKQYKANQPHTAGSKWFDMPATPMTPELKREIDAMRLKNALDPKKFMKGGAKNEKIGEFFQVGHIITPNTRATTSNSLPTASKRSFVEELVEDEQARAYAKKKTKEVMQKGMSGRKRQRKGSKGSYAMGMGGGKDGAGASGGSRRKR
ncbi:Fcf2 domain-containing protein [Sporobolomyces salmoneus]|uniref:Fcf2 domain-containing protein n=1 Tax=Sporobolomyces salmoneus TaxID=183962 RepID=UPI00317891FC